MSAQDFWQDSQESLKVIGELKNLRVRIQPFKDAEVKLKDIKELGDIAVAGDSQLILELNNNLDFLVKDIDSLEFKLLLSQEFDSNSAILSINAGAGGTESCDWADMLFRMYCRFAESKGYKTKVADILHGEEAGIKNVTLLIEGPYAYGYLKAEAGVPAVLFMCCFARCARGSGNRSGLPLIPISAGIPLLPQWMLLPRLKARLTLKLRRGI